MPPDTEVDTKPEPKDQPDLIKNMKAEMDRKLGNVESTLTQLASTSQALSAQLEKLKPAPAPTNTKSWREKFYDDENAALAELEENATRRATEAAQAITRLEQQKNANLSVLVNDYPELTDQNGDLRKKAVEIFNALSPEEQKSPSALKLAVREAAADLALLPMSKRKKVETEVEEDDDSFSLNGGSGRGNTKRKGGKEPELSDATKDFAELLGRPVDDPKYLERLKKANQRTNWSKYRKVTK